MPLDPLKDAFWEEDRKLLFGVLVTHIEKAAAQGLLEGFALLDELGLVVDFSLVNEAAAGFAQTHTFNLVKGISNTQMKTLQGKHQNWINSGGSLPDLKKALRPMYGKHRANMIAVTETTRIFALANVEAWAESGHVKGKRWITVDDTLVCTICEPLHNVVVPIESSGFNSEGVSGLFSPPAHVNCRCAMRPVVKE